MSHSNVIARRLVRIVSAALSAAVVACGHVARAAESTQPAPATRPAARSPDAAADKALSWLAVTQLQEGHWPTLARKNTSVPSLVVRAYLARGHRPGFGTYGKTMDLAIDHVLSKQSKDGFLGGDDRTNSAMYAHGIAAVMAAEAHAAMSAPEPADVDPTAATAKARREARRDRLKDALVRAAACTLKAQAVRKHENDQGGWRYHVAAPDSDISVTGWHLAALRGAADRGVEVPAASFEAGRAYVLRCYKPSAEPGVAGGFSYQWRPGRPNPARTGSAIVSLAATGDPAVPEGMEGGRFLLANPVTNPAEAHYYYACYYVSRAYRRLGGEYWDRGFPPLRDALLAGQAAEGHWPGGSGVEREAGDAYRTAMAVLALFPPAERVAPATRPATTGAGSITMPAGRPE